MKKHSKYIIPSLLVVYVLEAYGSLILFKYDIISVLAWRFIHHVGICILLCSFLFLVKDKIKDVTIVISQKLMLSIVTSFFIGRLITQLNGGLEGKYEMINIIALTIVFHLLVKHKDCIIRKLMIVINTIKKLITRFKKKCQNKQ